MGLETGTANFGGTPIIRAPNPSAVDQGADRMHPPTKKRKKEYHFHLRGSRMRLCRNLVTGPGGVLAINTGAGRWAVVQRTVSRSTRVQGLVVRSRHCRPL